MPEEFAPGAVPGFVVLGFVVPGFVVPGFVCDAPALPAVFPDAEEPAFEPALEVPTSDPGLETSGFDPGLGVPGFVEPVVPAAGKAPQGDPPGVVPGLFDVFGLIVEGEVLVPGVAGAGEFDPGTFDGDVVLGVDPLDVVCGAVCGVAD